MPIYEYWCQDCRTRSALLVLNLQHPPPLVCQHCNGGKLTRLLSRFAAPKSAAARLESLADPSLMDGLDENNPESMARVMKQMGEEMDEDVGGVEDMLGSLGDNDQITADTDEA